MTGLGISRKDEMKKEPKMNGFRGVHFLERPPYNLTGCPNFFYKSRALKAIQFLNGRLDTCQRSYLHSFHVSLSFS